MDLKTLIPEAFQIAKEHGWHDPEPNFDEVIANIHAECAEAWEDFRNNHGLDEICFECHGPKDCELPCHDCCKNNKPCGIPVEFADIVIRSCDWMGTQEINFDTFRPMYVVKGSDRTFAKIINVCHKYLDHALCGIDSAEILYGMIREIEIFCGKNGIDLDRAIALKTNYNRGRSHRHGGKRV